MTSPNMTGADIALDTPTQIIAEKQIRKDADGVADAALAARALVVVVAMGGGIRYLLWKTSLYFVVGH